MSVISKILGGQVKSERGQALMLFVGIFTIIMVAGAIAVDFGMWLSERRGAQTDADLSSLAGAQVYELCLAVGPCTAADDTQAAADASAWLGMNNQTGNSSAARPIAAVSPCVTVDVKHQSRALFGEFFGIAAPNIGAHAKACAGAISGTGGAVPIEIANTNDPCFISGQPNYTALCLIESGSGSCPNSGSTPTPTPTPVPCNPHGILDLNASPACSQNGQPADIQNLIANGSTGTCRINTTGTCNPAQNGPWYNCVAVQTGNPSAVISGFQTRIFRQGSCDDDGNGVEDFSETVNLVSGSGATGLYEARVCPKPGFWDSGKISSRIITIIVLNTNPPPGNTGRPIDGFASFYFAGCWDDRNGTPTSVSQLDKNCTSNIPPGHNAIYAQFFKLIVAGGDVGPPNPSSTLFGVHLVE